VVAHDRNGVYVSCADAVLQVTELQFAGRKRCSAAQALNAADLSGRTLGRDA
jgi:methionyl-tRNA formyltransferase